MAMAVETLYALWQRAKIAGVVPIPRIHRPLTDRERIALWAAVLAMAASAVIVQMIAIRQ